MQQTWVWSLGQADTLETEMVTHSSIIAWEIPWTDESGRLQFMVSQRVEKDWVTNTFTFTVLIVLLFFSHSALSNTFQTHALHTPGFPVLHHFLELAQTHVHWVGDHPTILSCYPLILLPKIFPSIRVFYNESALHIRWPKHWSFSFSMSLSMNIQDWFPLGLTGLNSL